MLIFGQVYNDYNNIFFIEECSRAFDGHVAMRRLFDNFQGHMLRPIKHHLPRLAKLCCRGMSSNSL